MGWGRMLLLGNWGQQMDIEDQRAEIRELKREMRRQASAAGGDLASRVDALQAENDELKLYLATLLRCLVSRGTVDIEEFRDLVRVIDAQDGAADGRWSGPVV